MGHYANPRGSGLSTLSPCCRSAQLALTASHMPPVIKGDQPFWQHPQSGPLGKKKNLPSPQLSALACLELSEKQRPRELQDTLLPLIWHALCFQEMPAPQDSLPGALGCL